MRKLDEMNTYSPDKIQSPVAAHLIGVEARDLSRLEGINTQSISDLSRSATPMRKWPAALRGLYRRSAAQRFFDDRFFLMGLGLAVVFATSFIDFLIEPSLFLPGLVLRAGFILPLAALAVFAGRQRWDTILYLLIGAAPILFCLILAYEAAQLPQISADRYLTMTGIFLGLANLIQPYRLRDLIVFDAIFIVCVSFAFRTSSGPVPSYFFDYELMLMGIAAVTLPVALRHERMREKNFLLNVWSVLTSRQFHKANRELLRLSERDPLTGLANRRYFERQYREATDARIEGRSSVPDGRFGLFMIDLDHFKAYNDRYGHQAGDRALVEAGEAIRSSFQSRFAMVARYGGEEFIAGLVETEEGQIEEAAHKIRSAIAERLVDDDGKTAVTASVGVAVTPAKSINAMPVVLEVADTALYAAKGRGRNRVEISYFTGARPGALGAVYAEGSSNQERRKAG